MTPEDVHVLFVNNFPRASQSDDRYEVDDLQRLKSYFGNQLPQSFLAMRALLPQYVIPGDHLPAAEMILSHEWETENNPNFTGDFVPFYAIGNGDYLCISRKAGQCSPVLYVAHDDPKIITIHDSFSAYLSDPEWFLR